MLINFDNITTSSSIATIVVAGADDEVVLEALNEANKKIQLSLILIGDQNKINSLSKSFNLNIKTIIHETEPSKIGELAVQYIKNNQANVIMKGLIDTKHVLKAVVNSQTGIKQQKTLSHVAIITYPQLNKSLIVSDCAMSILPNADDKWEIINNAVNVAHKLDIKYPNVALISAVEKINPKIVSTTDAQQLIEKHKSLNIKEFNIDGPFALDNVLSHESAHHKGITSNVALNPDILIFPDLVSGNVFYKASVFLGNGQVAGVIVGASVPIILTSRGDSAASKMNSIILGILLR